MNRIAPAVLICLAAFAGFGVARIARGRETVQGLGPSRPGPTPSRAPRGDEVPADPQQAEKKAVVAVVPMSTRILDLFLGDLTDEEIETVLKLAVAHSEANVNRVLDLYFESSLPEVFELAKRLLEWREEAATPRLLESLADEIDYGRRQSTVWILGDSARMPGVLPVLESILDGSDVLLKEQVLARLRVNGVPEEGRSRMAQRLRDIVRSGGPSALRGAAAGALRGDDSKVGVRFLLDRVLDDPDFEVRQRALGSLPIVYSDDEGALEEEVLSGLYAVSMNLALPANLRRSTVRKLSWNLRSYKGDLFSQDQLAAIDVWVESFKK